MSARFFGSSQQPLFGIYHPARGRQGANHNVVLCPPLGHELIRSHRALRNLASKLSRKGMNVFRFDYRGTGDSSIEIEDIQYLQSFVADAAAGALELIETSTAVNARLSFVGLRMGGIIAALAAQELAEESVNANVICWDCPVCGNDYLQELRAMHHRMVDLWTSPVKTENSDSHEEILGFRYSRSLLNDIEQCNADECLANVPELGAVVNSKDICQPWKSPTAQNDQISILSTEDPSDWDDLNYIEEVWLPLDGTAKIVDVLQQVSQTNETSHSVQKSGSTLVRSRN